MKKTRKPDRLFFILQKLFGVTRRQQFGTLLIVIGTIGIAYIYYPLIQLFVPEATPIVTSKSRIEIPKINVAAPINWDVDPFDENVYRKSLESGIAHAKNTSYPNASGTTYLFAHSSDAPWRITRYNVVFFRLGELLPGDEINVWRDGEEFTYLVREKKTVWPDEIKYLTKSTKSQLILQTCTPIGTALQRLLIFADPL